MQKKRKYKFSVIKAVFHRHCECLFCRQAVTQKSSFPLFSHCVRRRTPLSRKPTSFERAHTLKNDSSFPSKQRKLSYTGLGERNCKMAGWRRKDTNFMQQTAVCHRCCLILYLFCSPAMTWKGILPHSYAFGNNLALGRMPPSFIYFFISTLRSLPGIA